ncbi:MdtA/MuxA family multidrug efflux RND transporter periplasmic adaptor subunit [Geotalea uraniireducens]|uniref:MdtA/MuxA family multidrug efflux RND transporter periplasmic adaptor subunit n=1 Tax=Geotalea uraniireducens TaxID=351604 RepID=UPI00248FEB33|nr:MdtA/MuxA family multidrug efflux RND transporter periplasmic adaptor subunit [Geotalea uraniireducens]
MTKEEETVIPEVTGNDTRPTRGATAGDDAITDDTQVEAGHNGRPTGSRPGGTRRWWLAVPLLLLVAGGIYLYGARAKSLAAKQAQKKPATMPVVAVPAGKKDVGVYLTGLGNVTALNTVTVKSRVDGQLMAVHFREGQDVRRGQLLAVIDPRPFQVQLTQAEGQMARDREQLNNARLDLQRYKQLWQQDSGSRQQYDTQEALVRQLEGSLKVDQGQIDSARLQLVYSRITAPVAGRVGLRQVDPGNIVHASDTNGLVVITQVQPITVVFPLPEDNLPKLLAKVKTGARLTVDAYDREQRQQLASGLLQTLDNQIDPTTGTVKLKAVFPNTDNQLFPNQFVNVRLLLETRRNAIVVPAAAIQRGSQGTFVYVVKADRTVTVRPVVVGVHQADIVSVDSGLAGGEMVVVEGAERLREGSKVELRNPAGTKGQQGTPDPGGRNRKGANQPSVPAAAGPGGRQ